MEIKKIEFNERPSLIEQEGSVVRINFDIETGTAVVNNVAEGEEPETREIFLAHIVRVAQPLTLDRIKAALEADGFDEYKSEAVAAEVMMETMNGFNNEEQALAYAKQMVVARISAYDKSDAVNQFTYNGVPMWLDKEMRNGLIARLKAEKAVGKEESTLWLDTAPFTINIDDGLTMLTALEVYASECFDKTAAHKSVVLSLEDIDDVLAYDFTDGYPSHPVFPEEQAV